MHDAVIVAATRTPIGRFQGALASLSGVESELFSAFWNLASNALQVHVFNLRSKLGKDVIQTVRGMGYRIPAPVAPPTALTASTG